MKTRILKQRDLENQGMKVAMALLKAKEREDRLNARYVKLDRQRSVAENKSWRLEQKLAGIKGLISACKNGQVEVSTHVTL